MSDGKASTLNSKTVEPRTSEFGNPQIPSESFEHTIEGYSPVKSSNKLEVSIVVPVYKSQQTIEELINRIIALKTFFSLEIVAVNDGSPDESLDTLLRLKAQHGAALKVVNLLKNSGQHNALLCGIRLCSGEIIVTIDDDLQNEPEDIVKLVSAIQAGHDVAIGAYQDKQHSKVRNFFGAGIDTLQKKLFHLPKDFQLTSFRAVHKSVVDRMLQMQGAYPYITSLILANASAPTNVPVHHHSRRHGDSNYTLKKSLSLALNLLLSYSHYPLYFVFACCGFSLLLSLLVGTLTFLRVLIHGASVPGWASIVVLLSFFSALHLFCLLLFGIYISRINQQISGTKVQYTVKDVYE